MIVSFNLTPDARALWAAPQSVGSEVLSPWLRISDEEITGQQCRFLYMWVCGDDHGHLLSTYRTWILLGGFNLQPTPMGCNYYFSHLADEAQKFFPF